MDKRKIVFVILVVFIISIILFTIIYIKNINNSNKQALNENMTDEEIIQKSLSSEEKLNLDNPNYDNLVNEIDDVLNQTDPLSQIPEE